MPEILLHYIWEHCLWADYKQLTTDGQPVEIISVGEHNRDSGTNILYHDLLLLNFQWLWILSSMRMLAACINLCIFE